MKKDKVVDRQISNSGIWAALLSRSFIDRQDYAYELMNTEFVYRHRYSQQPLITNSSGISFGRRHEVILQIDREHGINRVIRRVRVICCSRASIDILGRAPTGFL
jgi:hypothetical protein